MGKLKCFVIDLFGNNPVYFAGSNIEGKVLLELTERKKTQGITIVLSGRAHVRWTEQHTSYQGQQQQTITTVYSDSETIFNDVVIQLWGNGRDSQEIGPGRYEFPFKFQLPGDLVLPTSYESGTGHIRYALTATISRPWKFNHVTKRAITVNEIVDINKPEFASALSSSNEKTLCCLCCASGPLSLSAITDRGGYCCGESIAISTEAENHSNRRVTAVRAALKQSVVCYASGRTRTFTKVIQRIEGPGLEPGGFANWSNELLPIPATVPTINSCRILKLSYVLDVTLALPRAIDLHVQIPLTIGNIPFRPVQAEAQAPYPPVNVNYAASYDPVYIGDDAYTMGEIQFAPVYGFVTDYRLAPPPSYSDSVVRVLGKEE